MLNDPKIWGTHLNRREVVMIYKYALKITILWILINLTEINEKKSFCTI